MSVSVYLTLVSFSPKAKRNSVIDTGLGTFENSSIEERCSVDEPGKENEKKRKRKRKEKDAGKETPTPTRKVIMSCLIK